MEPERSWLDQFKNLTSTDPTVAKHLIWAVALVLIAICLVIAADQVAMWDASK